MNIADSEIVIAIVQMDGFEYTENILEADVILINTCSVRENAEKKIFSRLQYFQSLKKKESAYHWCIRLYGKKNKRNIDTTISC